VPTVRIAIVSDFYLDYVGGMQSSLLEQRAALEAAGHEVLLVSTVRGARQRVTETESGLEIRPAYTVPGVILPVVRARKRLIATLREYFERHRVDVVHLQTEFGLAHAATSAAREAGIPVVHTIHTFYWQSTGAWQRFVTPILRFGLQNVTGVRFTRQYFTDRSSDNLLRNLTLGMARRVDTVVSPSAHQAADLAAAGITVPIAVVPNPIARSPRPAAVLTQEQATAPKLLWVARCEPEKRPLVFAEAAIAALAALPADSAKFEVDFVGDGGQLSALREVTAGHPQIRVHGNLPHQRVVELMDAASLVALTSSGFDNQPMTIAEASSRYRGVLYCDPNLREGLAHSGFLTESPDAASFATAIVTLVRDPAALIALSEGAQLDSTTFSAATYVERIMRVYADAGARGGGGIRREGAGPSEIQE
jgi:glycosyltransferase involved in cell wall biosynthesis